MSKLNLKYLNKFFGDIFINPTVDYDILISIFQAFEELERRLTSMSICVAVKEKLTKDSGVAGGEEYDHIVKKLLAKPKAKGKSHNVKSKT